MVQQITVPKFSRTNTSTGSQILCEKCKDTGWIINENNFAVSCECRNKKIRYNRIKFANIPEAFRDIRLSSFNIGYYENKAEINEVIKTVKYFLANLEEMKNEGVGLYLYSETKGSGKTRMATSLANELIHEHDMTVRYTTSVEIISEIKASWRNDAEFQSESQLLRYLTNAEVLVIDDFGTEILKDWINEKFYQIINSRYAEKRMTIYTSNHQISDLKYDDRIIDRITERVYQVHFPEESIRKGIAAARERKLRNEIQGG